VSTLPETLAKPTKLPSVAAQAWVKKNVATEVGRTIKGGRDVIRQVITDRMFGGLPKADAVKLIKSVIGLNANQVKAVNALAREMEKAGLPSSEIARRGSEYAGKLLQKRAETIAEYELVKTKAAAQQLKWAEWQSTGKLKKGARKMWVAQSDACADCAELDGDTAPLGGRFGGGEFDGPPAHINCRCKIALVGPERQAGSEPEESQRRQTMSSDERRERLAEVLSSIIEAQAPPEPAPPPVVEVAAPVVHVLPPPPAQVNIDTEALGRAFAQMLAPLLTQLATAIQAQPQPQVNVPALAPAPVNVEVQPSAPTPVVVENEVNVPEPKVVVREPNFPKYLKVVRDPAGRMVGIEVEP
jgi:hypothetical protein